VDTNSDPRQVDFPIPANDDASKSIALIVEVMVKAIEEGLIERKLDKDKRTEEEEKEEKFEAREEEAPVAQEAAGQEAVQEVDEEGIVITRKEHVEKVVKMKEPDAEPEKPKIPRKRITKPVGKSGKK
jgi:phage FluMu gp28-like protein